MTEIKRTRWGSILSGVPKSAPSDEDNVVHMARPSLDEMARQLIDAQNGVIDAGVECDRAAMVYTERLRILEAARVRMAERMKELDGKLEFVRQYPEIDT